MTVSYGMSIMCLITIYVLSPSYRPVCGIVLYRTPHPTPLWRHPQCFEMGFMWQTIIMYDAFACRIHAVWCHVLSERRALAGELKATLKHIHVVMVFIGGRLLATCRVWIFIIECDAVITLSFSPKSIQYPPHGTPWGRVLECICELKKSYLCSATIIVVCGIVFNRTPLWRHPQCFEMRFMWQATDMYDVFAQLFAQLIDTGTIWPERCREEFKVWFINICIYIYIDYFLSISCATVPSIDNTSALARWMACADERQAIARASVDPDVCRLMVLPAIKS